MSDWRNRRIIIGGDDQSNENFFKNNNNKNNNNNSTHHRHSMNGMTCRSPTTCHRVKLNTFFYNKNNEHQLKDSQFDYQHHNFQYEELKSPHEQKSNRYLGGGVADRLLLNPFQKWKLHKKFPNKFVIHIILVVLVTAQTFIFVQQETAHLRITLKNLHFIFFEDDYSTTIKRKLTYHSPVAFETALIQSFNRYFTLNDHTVNTYDTINNSSEALLQIEYKNHTKRDIYFQRDFLHEEWFKELLKSVRSLKKVVLNVGLRDIYDGPFWTSCFQFNTKPTFDYSHGGLIEAFLDWSVIECRGWIGKLNWPFLVLHSLAIIGCLISFILSTRNCSKGLRDFRKLKRVTTRKNSPPSSENRMSADPKKEQNRNSRIYGQSAAERRTPPHYSFIHQQIKQSENDDLSVNSSPNHHPPPHPHSIYPIVNGCSARGLTRVKTSAFNLNTHLVDNSKFKLTTSEKELQQNTDGSPVCHTQKRFEKKLREDMNWIDSKNSPITIRSPQLLLEDVPSLDSQFGGQLSHDDHEILWSHFVEKFQYFYFWNLLSFISNFIHFIASLWCFIPLCNISNRLLYFGFATFFSYINLLRYLEYSPTLFILMQTLKKGLPKLGKFLVSVVPLFYAFSILGVCLFWSLNEFSNISDSSEILFSVLNGDELHDMFGKLGVFYPILSQIYLYSFTCVFMYVVLNVFISIITESFFLEQNFAETGVRNKNLDIQKYRSIMDHTKICPVCGEHNNELATNMIARTASQHSLQSKKSPNQQYYKRSHHHSANSITIGPFRTTMTSAKLKHHHPSNDDQQHQDRHNKNKNRLANQSHHKMHHKIMHLNSNTTTPFKDVKQPFFTNLADGSLTVWQPDVSESQESCQDGGHRDMGQHDNEEDIMGIRLIEGPFSDFNDDESLHSTCHQKRQKTDDTTDGHSEKSSIHSSNTVSLRSLVKQVEPFWSPNKPKPEPHSSWMSNFTQPGDPSSARERNRRPPKYQNSSSSGHSIYYRPIDKIKGKGTNDTLLKEQQL